MSSITRRGFRTFSKVSPLVSRAYASTTAATSTTDTVNATAEPAEIRKQSNVSTATAPNSNQPEPASKKKTQLQLDEELRLKMSGLSGDGGESGVEYEDGVPVSMKRSVKSNMFRYI
ncbi:hypothetical protein B0A48_09827 [Cryoendolithus antarcticus]|uniref:Uncharacterized protein n=1 Tax=Cryoendolithus antarcticus TaxID=1507870 RepID=A0A1V8T2U0_9PEZI|nr:hypothetical protein B0A48_09827 [Cryoendolithus antarcticus]